MARTAFATTLGDLYTIPLTTTTAIVTNIVVTNTAPTVEKFTITLDGVELFDETPIAGNSTISIDMKQVLDAQAAPTKKIRGFATSTSVKVHISGIEVIV